MIELIVFTILILLGYLTRIILVKYFSLSNFYEILLRKLVFTIYNILAPLSLFIVFSSRGLLRIDLIILINFLLFMFITYYLTTLVCSNDIKNVVFIQSTFPNSVFLGFPISLLLFGNIRIAALIGALTVALNFIVPDLIVLKKLSTKSFLQLTPLYGFTTGLIFHYTLSNEITSIFRTYLWWTTPLLSYIAVYTMGMRIPLRIESSFIEYIRIILFTGFARYVLAPLLSFLTSLLAGFDSEDSLQLIVVSMMPPAVLNIVVAQKYNWDSQLVALTVSLLTIIFLTIVLPILYIILKQ
uniref:Uncharacterized protein n=1 Tax=Staphylothermus marinus TaxID=2280 RepID=A0A7C4HFK4_STAMA